MKIRYFIQITPNACSYWWWDGKKAYAMFDDGAHVVDVDLRILLFWAEAKVIREAGEEEIVLL